MELDINKVLDLYKDMKYIIICRNEIISVRSLDFDVTTLTNIKGHKLAGGAKLSKSEIDQILTGELKL